MKNVTAIILAAGRGTRMKSASKNNKVTLTLGEKPMIQHTVDNVKLAGVGQIIVVIGHASESVQAVLGDSVEYAVQAQALGTGDALKSALDVVSKDSKLVVSMYGDDSAFYPVSLLIQLIKEHQTSQAVVSVLTLKVSNPMGLGRILRNEKNEVVGIVEEKNATEEQRQIREINTGLYCFNLDFIQQAIERVKKNPVSGEYYLTDVVELACSMGEKIHIVTSSNEGDWCGVNTPEQLVIAQAKMRARM